MLRAELVVSPGLKNFMRSAREMSMYKSRILRRIGEMAKGHVKNPAMKHRATRALQNSISTKLTTRTVTVTGNKYWKYALEKGRGPSRSPKSKPSVEALSVWAGIKLGNSALGPAIANSIIKRGTKKYRDAGANKAEVTAAYRKVIQEMPKVFEEETSQFFGLR